jgi:hypothetical protein
MIQVQQLVQKHLIYVGAEVTRLKFPWKQIYLETPHVVSYLINGLFWNEAAGSCPRR